MKLQKNFFKNLKIESLLTILQVSRGQYTGYEVITKVNGVYTADADLDMDGNDITGLEDISFNEHQDRNIINTPAKMQIEVESAAVVEIVIDDNEEYTFTSTTLDMHGGILSEIGLMQGETTRNRIDDTTDGWLYSTDRLHRFAIGGENKIQIAATAISFEDTPVQMKAIATPPRPANDIGRLFMRNNGSGKTEFCIIFNTGAVQVIATEP